MSELVKSKRGEEGMMKRTWVGLGVLLVAAPFGYCQESPLPLRLTIKSDKQVYQVGEEIACVVTIKNFTPAPWNIFNGIHSSIIIIDSKEYHSRQNFPFGWGSPNTLSPGGEISVALSLSEKRGYYDISEGVLAVGEHQIAVKMNKTISNTITIEVVEQKGVSKVNSNAETANPISKNTLIGEWSKKYFVQEGQRNSDERWVLKVIFKAGNKFMFDSVNIQEEWLISKTGEQTTRANQIKCILEGSYRLERNSIVIKFSKEMNELEKETAKVNLGYDDNKKEAVVTVNFDGDVLVLQGHGSKRLLYLAKGK